MRSTYARVIGVTLLWAFLASPLIISTHFAQTKELNRLGATGRLSTYPKRFDPDSAWKELTSRTRTFIFRCLQEYVSKGAN